MSQWLREFGGLLRRPVAWLATLLFYIAFTPLTYLLYIGTTGLSYWTYTLLAEVLRIALFGAYAFPLIRALLRDRYVLATPRLGDWLGASALQVIATYLIGVALAGAALEYAPAAVDALPPAWQTTFFLNMTAPLFLGVFVWQAAMVCGWRQPDLPQSWNLAWSQRGGYVLLYALLVAGEIALTMWLDRLSSQFEPWELHAIAMIPYCLLTMLLTLFVTALLLENKDDDQQLGRTFG